MAVIRRLRRIALTLVAVSALLVVIGPWGLYWLGLHAANGKPEPSKTTASLPEQLAIWHKLRGQTQPTVLALNPYTYLSMAAASGTHKPGLLLAWGVATSHTFKHQRYKGMLWWHLSGAALTIWLTQNWSVEQLLSKSVELQAQNAG